jgi:hypothetical protein
MKFKAVGICLRQQKHERLFVGQSIHREISALLSGERLKLRETERAVTPLDGVAVFVET